MNHYTLRKAEEDDISALHRLLTSDASLRRLSPEDIRERVEGGIFLALVEEEEIIATVHVWGPEPGSDPPEWELGGAVVNPDYRKRGLGAYLVDSALAMAYLSLTEIDENSSAGPPRLIGHVVSANAAPRGILTEVGFRLVSSGDEYNPEEISGLESMPTNKRGMVVADLFALSDAEAYRNAIERLCERDGWIRGIGDTLGYAKVEVGYLQPELLCTVLDED